MYIYIYTCICVEKYRSKQGKKETITRIHLSIYPYIYLYIYLSIYLSISLFTCVKMSLAWTIFEVLASADHGLQMAEPESCVVDPSRVPLKGL